MSDTPPPSPTASADPTAPSRRRAVRAALRDWGRPARGRLRLLLLAGSVGAGAALLQAWALSGLLAMLLGDTEGPPAPLLLAALLGGAFLLRAVLAVVTERLGTAAGDTVRAGVRARMTARAARLGPAALEGRPAGAFATAYVDQVDALHGYYARYLVQSRLILAVPLALAAVAATVSPLVALLLLATVPLIVLAMALVGLKAAGRTRASHRALARMGGYFLDRLQGLATLQLFGRGADELARISAKADGFRHLTMRVLRIAFLSAAALDLISGLAIALVATLIGLALLGQLHGGGLEALSLREGLFLLLLAPEFFQPFRQLSAVYHDRLGADGAAQALLPLVPTEAEPALPSPDAPPLTAAPALRLDALTLCQPGRNAPLLEDAQARLPAGGLIALVGESGAGKSTLLHAIAGLHAPDGGRILLDGRDLPPAQRRSGMALLTQRPYLFPGSLRDNLLLGAPQATPAQVDDVLAATGLAATVAALPQGLDTVLGERGSGLSGGQAQRLALARAVLKDARLLLLDEPTAGLDASQERAFLQALQALRTGRTVLVATHSAQAVAAADAVWRIDRGRLLVPAEAS